jgi:hypothetical protein
LAGTSPATTRKHIRDYLNRWAAKEKAGRELRAARSDGDAAKIGCGDGPTREAGPQAGSRPANRDAVGAELWAIKAVKPRRTLPEVDHMPTAPLVYRSVKGGRLMTHPHSHVHVVVHYIAAERPFEDRDANPAETIGSLKAKVLAAFGLTEGNLPDGNIAQYILYFEKIPLENMGQTIGELAAGRPVLQLKLCQHIVQGRR